MRLKIIYILLLSIIFCGVTFAQKKSIDSNTHKDWRRVTDTGISGDGNYVKYKYTYMYDTLQNKKYKNKIHLYNAKTRKTTIMDSITSLNFWANGKWIVYDEVNAGKKTKILQKLKNGKKIVWDRASSPNTEMNSTIISYRLKKDLVVLDIENGDSIIYKNIERSEMYDNGEKVIYIKAKDDKFDLCCGDTFEPSKHKVIYSDKYKTLKSFGFSRHSKVAEFEIPVDTALLDGATFTYKYDMATSNLQEVFNSSLLSVEDKSVVPNFGHLDFLKNKNFVVFNVSNAVKKPKVKRDKSKKDKSFELELWSWNDPVVQSVQAISYYESSPKPVKYIYNVKEDRSYPITSKEYTSIYFSNNINSEYAILTDETPYKAFSDWENQDRFDCYIVNLLTGEKQIFAKKVTNRPEWSHNGDFIVFWSSTDKAWFSLEPKGVKKVNLTKDIPYAVHKESHDRPNPVPSYGLAAWTIDGSTMVIYDSNDIWLLDITGDTKPICYTNGYGRENNKTLRLHNYNYSDLKIDISKKQELEVYCANRDKGFYTMMPSGKMIKNIEGAFALKVDKVSDDKKTYMSIKQSFTEDRDLWITNNKFKKMHRITDVSPQLKDYKLGAVKIVEWKNYDGGVSKGLLYTPEGYERGKSYPTIVNFYETHTGGIHTFHAPGLSNAMLNVADYVSNGYVIFMPDVYFEIGDPAKSSHNIVVSGVKSLIERGIIDAKRVGLQGHSWSGYQSACLVTMTDVFTCANIGAPISNMTSGYVGLREGTGKPRMFMYEDWQCRMGATLWEDLDGYIRNSPILYADKIKTPILIFHCDEDEAVSFTEGRSLFLALRRLQIPSWMVNYKGEGHFVMGDEASADWTKRMKQFFDYYLNNTPMPRWMDEGININERGYDQKYDYVK